MGSGKPVLRLFNVLKSPISDLKLDRTPPEEAFVQSLVEVFYPPVLGHNEKDGYFIVDGSRRILGVIERTTRELPTNGKKNGDLYMYVYEDIDRNEGARIGMMLNAQREKNEVQDAKRIKMMLRAGKNFKEIAESIFMPISYVKCIDRKWAPVDDKFIKATLEGKMAPTTAIKIGQLPKERQEELAQKLKETKKLTGRDVDNLRYAVRNDAVGSIVAQLPMMNVRRNNFSRGELENITTIDELKQLLA